MTNTRGNNQPKLHNQILMIQPAHPYQAQSTKAINTEQALKAFNGPESTNVAPFHKKSLSGLIVHKTHDMLQRHKRHNLQ